MMETLTILLRIAGAGLILLAALHVPIGRHLKWREDGARLSPVNASSFRVHTFFFCFVLTNSSFLRKAQSAHEDCTFKFPKGQYNCMVKGSKGCCGSVCRKVREVPRRGHPGVFQCVD